MTRARARFEIVHNPRRRQPWHARYVSANGETVWWTENYAARIDAERAIDLLPTLTISDEIRTVEDDDS